MVEIAHRPSGRRGRKPTVVSRLIEQRLEKAQTKAAKNGPKNGPKKRGPKTSAEKNESARKAVFGPGQIANLLMITTHTLYSLTKDGHLKKDENGNYGIVDAVQSYIIWLRRDLVKNTATGSTAQVQKARAEEIQLRIAQKEGKLLDIELMEDFITAVVGGFRSRMAGVPAQVTRDLELREKIEQAINDAFDRLRSDATTFGSFAEGSDPELLSDEEAVPG